jgi:hypothetical protein
MAAAAPSLADQVIRYEGETSATTHNRLALKVLKRDNGRRFIKGADVRYTLTCEDATTERWGIGFGFISTGGWNRVGDDGTFSLEFGGVGSASYFALEGTVGFRQGSGTFEVTEARLTDDLSDPQICTTGTLTWMAERTDARPARGGLPAGTGLLKLRGSGAGFEVVRRVEP